MKPYIKNLTIISTAVLLVAGVFILFLAIDALFKLLGFIFTNPIDAILIAFTIAVSTYCIRWSLSHYNTDNF
jgi:hypothetical protein